MKLRNYEKTDSPIICSWIKTEEALYKWSADRIGHFPLEGDELNEEYFGREYPTPMHPMTMTDEDGTLLGHILLRYPEENDMTHIRFGFVIVDSEKRGLGLGKKLLELAKDYAVKELGAKRITLGVFSNNPPAMKCYESAGFKEYGERDVSEYPVGSFERILMEYLCEDISDQVLSAGFTSTDILKAFGIAQKTDLREMNPLVLAHVGDAVYELVIRTVVAETMNTQVQKVHKKCTELVNCRAQCEIMHMIEDRLTEEEHALYKRARNTKSYTMPKNATPADYRTATGFEALIGWLYLTEKTERIFKLLSFGLNDRK